jgi:hypothetical protein
LAKNTVAITSIATSFTDPPSTQRSREHLPAQTLRFSTALAEIGSLSIEKAAIHPRGCTVAGGLWKHAAVLGAQVFCKAIAGARKLSAIA